MKVKVQFTVEIDPQDFRDEYANPEMTRLEVKEMMQGEAEGAVMAWLERIGVRVNGLI
jgi:hypothetical protein